MRIDIFVNSKGGMGTSIAASYLAQSLISKGEQIRCIDARDFSRGISVYSALPVEEVQMRNEDGSFGNEHFDQLFEKLESIEAHVVMETSAAMLKAIVEYMLANQIVRKFEQIGKKIVFHTVITRFQPCDKVLTELRPLLAESACKVVVWDNDFFGEVEVDGKSFRESDLYLEYASRISAVISLRCGSADTFGHDLNLMLSNALTFEEANVSPMFHAMQRARIQKVKNSIFDQLHVMAA